MGAKPGQQSSWSAWQSVDAVHLSWCVGGIMGSLLLYGILQERIMTEPFGGEPFRSSLLLVLCNRLLTAGVSFSILVARGLDMRPAAPAYAYAAVSLSNVVATLCQYEALKYLTFPLQTLAKCAKMIPVMLWGALIMHKVYKPKEYGLAAAITVGCALFIVSGRVASKVAAQQRHTSLFGVALMLTYLAFDGFTSTWQDRLFKGYSMSIYNQSLYVTLMSAAYSVFGLLTSRQLGPGIAFLTRHPEALWQIASLSAAATAGQLFIVHTIKSYGALLFATVMTTRQFLSILLSCILYRHPLTAGQWLGTAVVFSAIYYKALSRRGKDREKAAATKASNVAAEGMTRHAANAGSVSAADFDRVSLSSAARTSPGELRESA